MADLLRQIGIMFVLMSIGALFRRRGILSAQASRDLGGLLINLVLPVVIVRSFWVSHTAERAVELAIAFGISLLLLLLAMGIARLVQQGDPVAEFSVAFSNAGFIGIPLVQAMLGEQAVLFTAPFIALLNVLQWTYGQYVLTGSTEHVRLRGVVTSPMFIALALGTALFLWQPPLPDFGATLLSNIANLNTPLAMVVLGCYLAESDIRSLLKTANLYVTAVERLLVVPLASMALLALLPCAAEIRLAVLIAAAAPVGTNVAIFAQRQGKDYRYACGCVCLTTLLSLVSIPAVMAVADLLL